MCSELNYAILHPHINSGSPVNRNLHTFPQELEVDLVTQVSQDFMGSVSVIQMKFSGLLHLEDWNDKDIYICML